MSGKRERAPAKGVMGSGLPTHYAGKECLAGDLHLDCVADKEVVKECGQWRHSEMQGKVGTQPREDPSAPSVADGRGSALSVWFAEE